MNDLQRDAMPSCIVFMIVFALLSILPFESAFKSASKLEFICPTFIILKIYHMLLLCLEKVVFKNCNKFLDLPFQGRKRS